MPFPAKYPGVCRVCKARFPAGTPIIWSGISAAHAACEAGAKAQDEGFRKEAALSWEKQKARPLANATPEQKQKAIDMAIEGVKSVPRDGLTATPQRSLSADGIITMPYDPDALPLLRAFPGSRWEAATKTRRCSVSEADLPRVLELADKLGLNVAPELRVRCQRTEQAAAANLDGLYPFQVAGVDHLSRRKRALMADEMGLGKTVQALRALAPGLKVLVICPNSLKLNWLREAKKWAPSYTGTAIQGRGNFRFPEAGEIVAVNYDVLPAELDSGKLPVPAGLTVIIDEAQYAKKYTAQRSKRVAVICKGAERVWALTGTPLANRPLDLWGVLNATGMAWEVFGSWQTFLRLFGGIKSKWGGYDFADRAQPEAAERMRRVMIRRLRTEVLPDLPSKTYTPLEVNEIGGRLEKLLDDLQQRLLEEGWDMDELPPFEMFSEIRGLLAKARIPAMLDAVEQHEEAGVPLVVFSAHRAPVDELGKREGWMTITGDTPVAARQEAVDAFQGGQLKGIALTIQAGGTGLTLTRASRMLFVDLDWVPANNAQAEDRICRIGQTAQKVEIIRMVSTHVLDKHVQSLLEAKTRMAFSAVDAEVEYDGAKKEKARALRAASEPVVSEAVKAATHQALRILAGMCDGAREEDGVGFNKIDTSFGKQLACLPKLTNRQAFAGCKIALRYHRQLPVALLEVLRSA